MSIPSYSFSHITTKTVKWRWKQSRALTCRQGGRTRPYSSRWHSRTRQSLGVGSPWTSQSRVSKPGRRGWRSSRSWSITRRHARLTARSRAANGLGGVRENWAADRDDCCCCRLSVDFLHHTKCTKWILFIIEIQSMACICFFIQISFCSHLVYSYNWVSRYDGSNMSRPLERHLAVIQ